MNVQLETDINKSKLRICILSGYPPVIGRGAEQVSVLTEQLKKYREFEIFILGNKAPDACKHEMQDSINIFRTWQPNSWASIFNTIRNLLRIRPHILHIHHPHLYYGNAGYTAIFILVLLTVARLKKIKCLVWWEHVYPLRKINKSMMANYHYEASPFILRLGLFVYTRLIGLLVNTTLVQTELDLKNIRESYRVKNVKSLIIGMSGKREPKDEAKRLLGIRNDRTVLLAFGFLSPYKGLVYAIEAMKKVNQSKPEAILLIAGSVHPRLPNPETYVNSLKLTVAQVGVGNSVVFHDRYIPKSEHSKYFSASEIVVLPYLSSLGPSSIGLEAFQYQVPVVATDVDFVRKDIIDQKTGILVSPSDSDALANAIITLLNDRKKYEFISNNVAAVASKYSMEKVSEQLGEIYRSL